MYNDENFKACKYKNVEENIIKDAKNIFRLKKLRKETHDPHFTV